LLGIRPTTLASQIKALGLSPRPAEVAGPEAKDDGQGNPLRP
jgi:hypothetical protein